MAYIDVDDLTAYGITDAEAEDYIDLACRIIDGHINAPADSVTGWKFPRASDTDTVPEAVRYAAMEQVRYLVLNGVGHLTQGGDDALSAAFGGGGSETKARVTTPLLAPMAKMYLRPFMTLIGYGDERIRQQGSNDYNS